MLDVLRPPLILGYTGSMRMIDEDEVGLSEKPEDTTYVHPNIAWKKDPKNLQCGQRT